MTKKPNITDKHKAYYRQLRRHPGKQLEKMPEVKSIPGQLPLFDKGKPDTDCKTTSPEDEK
jgi:hypothetical protein